jgi:putative ABC transport system permease protein
MLIFGMNTVLPTMLAALQANVQGAEGNVDFTITNVSGQSFPADVDDQLRGLDGVRAVSASLNSTINLPADFVDKDPSRPDTLTVLNLIGVVPEDARSVRSYPIVAGRYLEASDSNAAVISQTLADTLSVELGDTFSLPSSTGMSELIVVGLLPGTITNATEEVWVNLPQAQSMMGEPGKVNLIGVNMEGFASEARHVEVQKNIEAALGEHYQVGTLMTGDDLFATMELARPPSLFVSLALFMGAFVIFNTSAR